MTYLDPNDCPWTPEYQMSQPGYKAELAQDMIKNAGFCPTPGGLLADLYLRTKFDVATDVRCSRRCTRPKCLWKA